MCAVWIYRGYQKNVWLLKGNNGIKMMVIQITLKILYTDNRCYKNTCVIVIKMGIY